MTDKKLVNIVSFNIQKTSNPDKLSSVVQDNDILLLQEANDKSMAMFRMLPNLTIIHRPYTQCAIIINHARHPITVLGKYLLDSSPHYVDVLLHISSLHLTVLVVCCYFPTSSNTDKLKAFDSLHRDMLSFELPSEIIWGGDFNFSLHQLLDQTKTNNPHNDERQLREFNDMFVHHYGLCDTFRYLKPNDQNCTNFGAEGYNCRRLDRIYLSKTLIDILHEFWQRKSPTIKSSHDLITVGLVPSSFIRHYGRKRFRVPRGLVYDEDFKDEVELVAFDSWLDYADFVKKYAIVKQQRTSEDLTKSINILEILKQRINKRTTFPTNITKLHDADGRLVMETKDLLHVAHGFYQNLYTADNNDAINNHYFDDILAMLTDEDQAELDAPVTVEEMKTALDAMKLTTAGEDGIPVELIRAHWDVVGPLLVKELDNIMNNIVIEKDILVILLKKKGSSCDIVNYRPISLSNISDRLIGKVMANRLSPKITKLISSNIHGFIPEANIDSAIFKYKLVFDQVTSRLDYSLANIDVQKAFDSVNNRFLIKLLSKMNFGPRFINFTYRILTDSTGRIMINNLLSDTIQYTKGLRQGCPLSPFYFLLLISVLITKLESNLQGLQISSGHHPIVVKTLSFADDLSVVLTPDDIPIFQQILDEFSKYSFLKVNPNKSSLIALAPERFSSLGYETVDLNTSELTYLGAPLNYLTSSQFIKDIKSSIISLGIFGVSVSYLVISINTFLLTKFKSKDTGYGFSPVQLRNVMLDINRLCKGVGFKKLLTPPEKGGFGLEQVEHILSPSRAKVIYNLLYDNDESNWYNLIWRQEIQTFLDITDHLHDERVPWSWFLTTKNDFETKYKYTDLLDQNLILCLKSWFSITQDYRKQTPVVRLDTVLFGPIDEDYFSLPKGISTFKHWRRNKKHSYGQVIISQSWSRLVHLTPRRMRKLYKKVDQITSSNLMIGDVLKRFFLGHSNFKYINPNTCFSCGVVKSTNAPNSDEQKSDVIRHRYVQCTCASILWRALGPYGYPLNLDNLFNPEMLVQNLILVSRYISGIHEFEQEMECIQDPIDDAFVEQWCVTYKSNYRRIFHYP